ncbi:MAG: acetylornithine deacetylase [Ottowia sp.]|nr:acetylornithine deacetylase [Ottowia sp.]
MTIADQACPQAALTWTKRLIAIDTTSRHSNLGLIELVRDTLKNSGVGAHLSYNRERNKANLFATVPATDGSVQGGIVLSGHSDVVPVDGQDWTSDPFKPEVRGGRLYGRGSCDMKGYIGAALSLLPDMLAAGLRKPIHFALSYDEEVGCLGAPVMLADLVERGVRPDGCIVGEPSSMRPIMAHKGVHIWRCKVHGRAAHSSLAPQGVNAIEYAARIIAHIRAEADAMQAAGPADPAFDVPFSTAQVCLIQGGIAVNTVPAFCQFHVDHRNLPGVDAARFGDSVRGHIQGTVLPQMRAEHPDADVALESLAHVPAFEASEDAAVTQMVRRLAGVHEVHKVAYASEAGQFEAAGIPTIICGPGDIVQAHAADEYVSLEQLGRCHRFLSGVIRELSAAG